MRLAAALLLLAAPSAAAQALVSGADAGLYETVETGRTADPGATSGFHTHLQSAHLLQRTTHVCVRLGSSFGLTFTLSADLGVPELPVVLGYQHPVMTNYLGQPQAEDDASATLRAGQPRLALWTFHDPTHLLPGRWRFTVSHGGVVLADQVFDVDVTCQKLVS